MRPFAYCNHCQTVIGLCMDRPKQEGREASFRFSRVYSELVEDECWLIVERGVTYQVGFRAKDVMVIASDQREFLEIGPGDEGSGPKRNEFLHA